MHKEWRQLLLVVLGVFLVPVVIAMGMVLVSRRAEPLGPGAEQAIDQAVQQLRDEALLTPATDWEALRQAAHRRLREAPSAARLDAELAGLVQALGDPHTSYQPPATARQIMAGDSSAAPVPDSAPVSAGQHGPWPVLALDAFGRHGVGGWSAGFVTLALGIGLARLSIGLVDKKGPAAT